ncbi:hypothetical protein PSU4_26060 [Pseudonocardia sulfidoxydans NBRC 16205]|uniref:Uncharacterized protein n=1 Tax=Pseudonocardia sulfidoxydans NBRC 16205 TaxID=1223511 RepID=A0A511DFU7_9PSEU|nr:hypothetical protein [Pseudonocardia sulfidoxydans]GEL23652.1 hypothetical protein PSU4_26060 [Pseudonocardia sulfidoxydans NBRC 16205]
MTPLSVLDPARDAEQLGCQRVRFAERHVDPCAVGAAPALLADAWTVGERAA